MKNQLLTSTPINKSHGVGTLLDTLPVKEKITALMSYDVVEINPNDIECINSIIVLESKVFGKGFSSKEELLRQIELSEYKDIRNSVGILQNGKLVGFGICYLGGKWTDSMVKIDTQFNDISLIGYIQTIIIDHDFRGKDAGKIVLDALLDNAKKAGNKQVLLHAWDGSPHNSSRRFFEKYGAKAVKIYYKKWYEDSLEKGWECSKCGNPCNCSSIEMIIDLEN